jgi:hypothetical protein
MAMNLKAMKAALMKDSDWQGRGAWQREHFQTGSFELEWIVVRISCLA